MASLHLLKLASMLVVIFIPIILANKRNFVSDEPLLNSLDQRKVSNLPINEYIRQVHSMIDRYNDDLNEKLWERNALIDTKYQTLKRNGDFINSLLSLPKGLNDAGR
ncbi:unnamed protein product [Euphydryas editha]|uniref:Uncharacterized protein n=1 Tax=Euphydryas editha TaxID=104508 RepID=A0AAU9TLY2_EUPED|nr:unnamed protein product [Euphydryas editha]